MTNQHRATDEQWLLAASEALDGSHADACLLELRDRIQQLEAAQYAHITGPSETGIKAAELEWARTAPGMRSDSFDRILALQDQIRDGALSLADAVKEINSEPAPRQPFTAKYLFTAGNIQQDSFYYDPSDSNSVLFDIANSQLGDGCLTPGDNIKIAHRWGELPVSGVCSTINYKIVSVSETENRAWTIRAVRVSSAPAAARQLTLVERVADAIAAAPFLSSPTPVRQARAAIREVAAWLQENPGPNSAWRAVARDLMDEANR